MPKSLPFRHFAPDNIVGLTASTIPLIELFDGNTAVLNTIARVFDEEITAQLEFPQNLAIVLKNKI